MKNTTQTTLITETQPKSIQKTCKTLSSSLEDFLAKLSVLLENEKDLTKQEELSFLKLQGFYETSNPGTFYSKTLKAYYLMRGGETLETIFRVCDELGYNVSWAIYNSCDYGVPQNRERIFIKGYFRGKCGQEVLSQTRDCEKITGKLIKLNNKAQAQTIYDIDGLATTLSANGGSQGGKTGLYKINKVGNVSPTNHHNGDVFSTEGIGRTLCARDYKDAMKIVQPVLTPDRENKRQNGRRMKNDGEPMFTLTAQDKHGVYDGMTVRKLTPVECERLQGFPDDWTKYGKDDELISDTQRYKCCGNAVTTNVITAIVDEMFDKVNK